MREHIESRHYHRNTAGICGIKILPTNLRFSSMAKRAKTGDTVLKSVKWTLARFYVSQLILFVWPNECTKIAARSDIWINSFIRWPLALVLERTRTSSWNANCCFPDSVVLRRRLVLMFINDITNAMPKSKDFFPEVVQITDVDLRKEIKTVKAYSNKWVLLLNIRMQPA